ncbi:MAG: hypothetical protein F4Y44_09770 [Chloroflexi bacterium]|nr:hypothetical protein [Chloroflexota bacterium]
MATVSIANAGAGQKTVYLRYRVSGGQWGAAQSGTTSGSSRAFSLSGLSAGTTYNVQAALNSSFSGSRTATFTTTTTNSPPPSTPSVSGVTVSGITQTSATATVSIANAGAGQKTVYLRYRVNGGSWSATQTKTTSGSSAAFSLADLTAGTSYEVEASLASDFSDSRTATFTTSAQPGEQPSDSDTLLQPNLASLHIDDVTQISAVANALIENVDVASANTAYLRHRGLGTTQWSGIVSETFEGETVSFYINGLDPGSTCEVQVSLADDFEDYKSAIFTTLAPAPMVSGVSVDDETQTAAIANISIANANGSSQTVHVRYRTTSPEGEWSDIQKITSTTDSAKIGLSRLTADTAYEVQVSLDSSFPDGGTAHTSFRTLRYPSISNLEVKGETQTTADAMITIADPDGSSQTVHVRYRTTSPEGEWSDIQKTTSTTDSAKIGLSGLTADTAYEVQVSLDSSFPDGGTAHTSFRTLRYPSISNLEVKGETQTTADAMITIADPDGSSQTVHVRYRTTSPEGEWSDIQKTTSTTDSAKIGLSSLTPDTEYESEASLSSDFSSSETDTFRTLPPAPIVSGVSVDDETQTAAIANISIANANGSSQTVHVRYRTTTPQGEWSDIQKTTSTTDSAEIGLSGLTADTAYEVQGSLDSSFPDGGTAHTSFRTLREPSVESVEAVHIGKNGATVRAVIADSYGVSQTVYFRHRNKHYNFWRPTQQADSANDSASTRIRGLISKTEYIVEASLSNSFPEEETESITFTTKQSKEDASDSERAIGVVAAQSADVPQPGILPMALIFSTVEGGDSPAPQTFNVWNKIYEPMDFTLSSRADWLSQEPISGTSNGPDDAVQITVSVDSPNLPPGQYIDVIYINVSSSRKAPEQVVVMLEVLSSGYVRQFVPRTEDGVVVLPDGTVKLVVQSLSPPKDVDVELMKVNLQAHGSAPGDLERVVLALETNTYEPDGEIPIDVVYTPEAELWLRLQNEDMSVCGEGRARVYSVVSGQWHLMEHRCEKENSDYTWVVANVERLGKFVLAIDDTPAVATPTPAPAALAAPSGFVTPVAATAPPARQISRPAQDPTPVPTQTPAPLPVPYQKPVASSSFMPTPTSMPTSTPTATLNEKEDPIMTASSFEESRGGFNEIILASLGVPLVIGAVIVVLLVYRGRRRNGEQHQ